MNRIRTLGLTLAIGLGGAALAAALGIPVAALVGACLATTLASWAGLCLRLDIRLRDLGFMIIGLSLGSGIGPDILQQAATWVFSLLLLSASIALMLLGGAWLLRRLAGFDRETALIAASPGAMSLALALTAEGRGNTPEILVVQSMRLLVLAALLPLALSLLGLADIAAPFRATISLAPLAALLAAGLAVSVCLKRIKVPAAFLLGGIATSAAAHVGGWVQGFPPPWILFIAFVLTGSAIGAQFSGITPQQMLRSGKATLVVVGVTLAVSAVFAAGVARIAGLSFAPVWVAFAPGGVEAMAAIGVALGYDAAFIAAHHLVRVLLLAAWIPLLLKR